MHGRRSTRSGPGRFEDVLQVGRPVTNLQAVQLLPVRLSNDSRPLR